jgi:trk system potassium uptake protein
MNVFIRYLGYILFLSAFFRIIPIIAGLIYNESITSFVIGGVISGILGIFFIFIEKKQKIKLGTLQLNQALMLVALSFIIIPLIGAISYLPSLNYNLLDAFFESISGFTTTGLTVYETLQDLPKSLLLWRATTQWIGGLGIIIVFLFIISRLRFHSGEISEHTESSSSLYQAGGLPQKLEPGLRNTSRNVFFIYMGLTLGGIVMLVLTKMSMLEAISLTFTSLSTGGFIITDTLNASNLQLGILSLLMILGTFSFLTLNKILQRKFKEFFFAFEKNIFFIMIIISSIITYFIFPKIKIVLFQLISAFTTTGFSITKISILPQLFIFILIGGMIIGGGLGSTAGGIKVTRVYTLLAMIPWMLKKLTSPRHAIIPLKIHGEVIDENNLLIISVFVTLFILTLGLGTLIFLLLGYNFLDSSFQMASALGTVGLQTISLVTMPAIGKLVLVFAMLLGRLEIFPLLILIRKIFKQN